MQGPKNIIKRQIIKKTKRVQENKGQKSALVVQQVNEFI